MKKPAPETYKTSYILAKILAIIDFIIASFFIKLSGEITTDGLFLLILAIICLISSIIYHKKYNTAFGITYTNEEKKKNRIKNIVTCVVVVFLMIVVFNITPNIYEDNSSINVVEKDSEETTTLKSTATTKETTTKRPISTTTQVPTTTQAPTTTQPPTTTETPTAAPEPEHRTGENIIGISDKDIRDISPSVHSVRNDKTGKWKISTIADNIDIIDYVFSYYKRYIHGESEVHAIVNFNNNTTTCISYMSGLIFVDIYDYVKGEEHDANILFSGTHLGQAIVYTDNGDIEIPN